MAPVTTSDTFVLTVTPGNTAPTIADIVDRSTNEDTSTGAIAFTIGDAETAVGSLTVTRASSNTAVVPLANVVLGGSGANRTVTVTPAANQSGTATITVTVSDGSAHGERHVRADRHRVNDPPDDPNILDRAIVQNASTGAISFTVGMWKRRSASLTCRGLEEPDAGAERQHRVRRQRRARTVTVTPAANQTGTATITVTVSDGAADRERHVRADGDRTERSRRRLRISRIGRRTRTRRRARIASR